MTEHIINPTVIMANNKESEPLINGKRRGRTKIYFGDTQLVPDPELAHITSIEAYLSKRSNSAKSVEPDDDLLTARQPLSPLEARFASLAVGRGLDTDAVRKFSSLAVEQRLDKTDDMHVWRGTGIGYASGILVAQTSNLAIKHEDSSEVEPARFIRQRLKGILSNTVTSSSLRSSSEKVTLKRQRRITVRPWGTNRTLVSLVYSDKDGKKDFNGTIHDEQAALSYRLTGDPDSVPIPDVPFGTTVSHEVPIADFANRDEDQIRERIKPVLINLQTTHMFAPVGIINQQLP